MRGRLRIRALCALAALLAAGGARAQQVTLSLDQFEELRTQANPNPQTEPAPPAPFALASADLAIDAGPESARVVQTLDLAVFADGWQKVPIGEAGSFIGAKFGDLEGRVEVAGDGGGWALQVRGRGRHHVTLESVVPVRRDESATRPTWRLALRFPPAAVVRGRMKVPATVDEVELQGAGLVRRDGDGWSLVAAPTAQAATFELRGKRVLPERARLPLRFEATSATAAVLSRTRLKVLGWVEARVAQGRLAELRLPVPEGLSVVSVGGPVAGWDVQGGTLVVTPLEPVEGSWSVEVELSGEPKAAFSSPLLLPQGSRRTLVLTRAAVQGDGLLDLDPGPVRPASETEAKGLPAAIREAGGRLLAVTDPARPPHWQVEWAERTEVLAAQIDRLLVDVALGESGRASYQLWAVVRNRGAQHLSLMLPAGFELASASRDGEPVSPGALATALAVPLLTRDAPQVVHLAGVLPLPLPKSGDFELPLPALSAPAARIEVRLVLPGGRAYTLADATRGTSVEPPPDILGQIAKKTALLSSNTIAQQVAPALLSSASDRPLLFPLPPGFHEVGAAWSALSATPAPLSIHIKTQKEDTEWF
jgi:hypothetical protein